MKNTTTSRSNQSTAPRAAAVILAAILGMFASVGTTRADTWARKADMPTPRWGHAMAVVNGKIYVIGGQASETGFLSSEELSSVEEYDPATDTWIRKADMPAGLPEAKHYRGSMSPPVMDGKIYLIGGGNPGLARVDIYDPTSDTWSRGADMPTARQIVSSVAFNGKIYAFGGIRSLPSFSGEGGLNNNEVYDPETDTWTEAAPIPRRVWGHSANVVDGKIHLIGGASATNAERIHQVYDPQTDTWTESAPMSRAVRQFGATVLRGKIYVVGGWFNSGQSPYSDTWWYDPILDTWTASTPLPERRVAPLCAVNGKIYAIGGSSTGHNLQATTTVYELTLDYDLTEDGMVDGQDMAILVEHWHTPEARYDLTGDGTVDVDDLIALSEHLFEDYRLLAHWMLDEAEGLTAYDSLGTNDGYLVGNPVWLPDGGQLGGAIQLDGVDDYVGTPFVRNPGDGPFSVFAWIHGGGPGQVVVSQFNGKDWMSIDTAGGLMTDLKGESRSLPLHAPVVIVDGSWHRVGLTWDGATRSLYVDDVMVAEDEPGNMPDGSEGLNIGCGANLEPNSFFFGLIDDVRIYNRAVRP